MAAEGEMALAAAAPDVGAASPSGDSPPLDMVVETPDPPANSNPTEPASLEMSKRSREEEGSLEVEKASVQGGAKKARVEQNSVEEVRLKMLTKREIEEAEKEEESARQGEGEGEQGGADGVKGEDVGEAEEGIKSKEGEEEEMEKEGEGKGTHVEEQREEDVKECGGSEEGAIKSESVKLGPKAFSSSVEMLNYFYKFLHFWPLNVDVNKYEYMIFLDLLKNGSSEADKKMGSGVQSFQIRVHPVWRSRCFFVMRTDGTFDDFSYRKSIDNILPLPENMKVPPAKADVDRALVGKKSAAHRQGGGGGKGNHGRGRGRNRK
ncbi:unnamed protein product [Victoria cruziana]